MRDASPPTSPRLDRLDRLLSAHLGWVIAGFLTLAAALRLYVAWACYLNPDEAMHALAARQGSLLDAYREAGKLAHPPLLVLVVYSLSGLGRSELVLRLPSVVAGLAAVWLGGRWIGRVWGPTAGLAAVVLLAWSPAAVSASSEVRQYGLLLAFVFGALEAMERFVVERSGPALAAHGACLIGAASSHYSALVPVTAIGIHVAVRLWRERAPGTLVRRWLALQAGLIALYAGLAAHALETRRWLAPWYLTWEFYRPGEESLSTFLLRAVAGTFRHAAGTGRLGVLDFGAAAAGGLFALGLAWTIRHTRTRGHAPLLVWPFVIGAALASVHLLPLGDGRHATFVLPFSTAGLAAGLSFGCARRPSLVVLVGLVAGPLWWARASTDNDPRIVPRRDLAAALDEVRRLVPRGASLFVDQQTKLVLAQRLGAGTGPVPWDAEEGSLDGLRLLPATAWAFRPETVAAEVSEAAMRHGWPDTEPAFVLTLGWDRSPVLAGPAWPGSRRFGQISLLRLAPAPRAQEAKSPRERGGPPNDQRGRAAAAAIRLS